jgi:hypothetical protein
VISISGVGTTQSFRFEPAAADTRDALEKTGLDVVQGHVTFDTNHQTCTNAVVSMNENGTPNVLEVVPTKK